MKTTKPDFSVAAHLFPSINREGKKFGFAALAIAVIVALIPFCIHILAYPKTYLLCTALTIPLFLLAYGVFLFFRDPERYPPDDPNAILSPADGRVCLIKDLPLPEELRPADVSPEEWNSKTFTRVSVFMSVFNVHVNRTPLAASILAMKHTPGKFLNAALDKASTENERCAYLMQTPSGVRYGVVQIAGLVAKRIVPFVNAGDSLETAQRFGLIRFGSRLDVYLPEGCKPLVREGQTMISGETVLGRIA